jgi:hypothetical protein
MEIYANIVKKYYQEMVLFCLSDSQLAVNAAQTDRVVNMLFAFVGRQIGAFRYDLKSEYIL